MRYLLILIMLTASAWAADAEANAVCTFADDTEMSVRYNPVSIKDNPRPQNGKVWAPGGSALLLFTQTELSLNNISLPVGAYSLYLIPDKNAWTLVVNKSVNPTGAYDEKADLVRLKMESAKLGSPADKLNISFGRIAPKQCEIRAYFDQSGTWATLSQK
ncbi:MAG TPA: DUF2911 domain-containing protein [Terriglobales bacterium]|jgi:hypothetical protein|nr:DUF2911 domain-containing protein [Terriglobales bacterium]